MSDLLLEHFNEQAGFCEVMGSPFTARLIEALARDVVEGGPTAALVEGRSGSFRADALALRLTGALHAAVLQGRAPALAALYPAPGRDWSMDAVRPVARDFLQAERAWVAAFISSAPQTNETRRTVGLLAGFLEIAKQHGPVMDTLEIGASAGLNLYWDRFAYRTQSWRWGGDSKVLVDTDWRGPPPAIDAPVSVRSRAACDLNPLDVADPAQRLQLRAYIWPDQYDRLARFEAAANLAVQAGVHVERADAADWLEHRLAARATDAVTVVYHSVFYQYPPPATRQRIAEVIAAAAVSNAAPLVWLRLEPESILGGPRDSTRFVIDMVSWPGGVQRTLAATNGHVQFVESLL